MPKKKQNESVLCDWVQELPFQMQALLLTGIRGADGNNKYNAAKTIIRYLRGSVIKAAGNWTGENDNDFMWGEYHKFDGYAAAFWDDHDQYPHHFIMHLIHCAQVLAYYYPFELTQDVREHWRLFYLDACHSFHMNPETKEQMDARLNDFGFGYIKNK